MNLNTLNPLLDRRWDELVARHPQSSAFHERGWLEALARTYGYEPFVLTSTAPGRQLTDGVVFCRVSSWITGTRLVSLPFADHCEPLLSDAAAFPKFIDRLRIECELQRCKYLELRPMCGVGNAGCSLQVSNSYYLHELDIRPRLDQIYHGLHKDSIERKIRRAKKERLSSEAGCSRQLIDEFYQLLVTTRRRHRLPPQPKSWFSNLVHSMGRKLQIRLARKGTIPIAAMLTLQHRSSIIYKYGCSDEKYHSLGGMPFLFWELIEDSKALGVEKIDFGRSDLNNTGLIAFKDRFGTIKRLLNYYRYPVSASHEEGVKWNTHVMKSVFSVLPDALLSTAGRVLYRHMG